MADKKVYAWAVKDEEYSSCFEIVIDECIVVQYVITEPLYSIEEVQYVIENNELPKRTLMYVVWDNIDSYKSVVLNLLGYRFENEVKICTADELLAELQKEI